MRTRYRTRDRRNNQRGNSAALSNWHEKGETNCRTKISILNTWATYA